MNMLSPSGRSSQPESLKPAPRVPELTGKTIGLLDNTKPQADTFLLRVAAILQERYGAGEIVHLTKLALSKPAPLPLIEELAERCDFVVTAIGD